MTYDAELERALNDVTAAEEHLSRLGVRLEEIGADGRRPGLTTEQSVALDSYYEKLDRYEVLRDEDNEQSYAEAAAERTGEFFLN